MPATIPSGQGADGYGRGTHPDPWADRPSALPDPFRSALARHRATADRGMVSPPSGTIAPQLVLRVLGACGVPYMIFDEAAMCTETSGAAKRMLADAPGGHVVRQQARAVASAALGMAAKDGSADQVTPCPGGNCGLHAVVLSGDGETCVVMILVPTPYAASESPRNPWGLTERELEVARLIAAGEPTKGVAMVLGISPHTARRHTEHVFAKLGVRSRTQVVRMVGGVTWE